MLRIGLLCHDASAQTHRVSLRRVKVVDFQVQIGTVGSGHVGGS